MIGFVKLQNKYRKKYWNSKLWTYKSISEFQRRILDVEDGITK